MNRFNSKPDLTHARRIVEDVSWLSTHHAHSQAAKRLAEVLYTVEEHLAQIRRALGSARATASLTPHQLLAFERDHRRLLELVEEAQTLNSRSDPVRCRACLRRVARSLERHERRDNDLLSRLVPSGESRT